MPYWPEVTEPLILHANDVARQQKPPLLPKQERADEGDLVELIKQAERKNAIVILLVDAWAARLPKYQSALCPYDDFDSLHTAVIVPTNSVDSETAQHLPVLQADVRGIFMKNFRGGRRFYRDVVTSLAEFRHALGEALIHTQSLVFENADVQRTVSSGDVIARPTITGPGGS
jgi:FxsC-like protein